MGLMIVDTNDLIEMRCDVDHIIQQAEAMNAEAKTRIDRFRELELDDDMKSRILDILFGEVE